MPANEDGKKEIVEGCPRVESRQTRWCWCCLTCGPSTVSGGKGRCEQQQRDGDGGHGDRSASPSINEVRLENDMFVTRLTFEFRVAHCEPRVSELLDYTAEELTGKNLYTLCHGQDVQKIRNDQQGASDERLLPSDEQERRLHVAPDLRHCHLQLKNSDEQSIICVNYVLSGIEYGHCILDCSQMPDNLKPDDPSHSERESSPEVRDDTSSRDGCCTPQVHLRRKRKFQNTQGIPSGLEAMQVELSQNGFEMEAKQLIRHPDSKHTCLETPSRQEAAPGGRFGQEEPRGQPGRALLPHPARGRQDRPALEALPQRRPRLLRLARGIDRHVRQGAGGRPHASGQRRSLPGPGSVHVVRQRILRRGRQLHGRLLGRHDAPPPPCRPGITRASRRRRRSARRRRLRLRRPYPTCTTPTCPRGAPLPLKPQVFVHPYAHSSEQQYTSGFHLYHPSGKAASHHPLTGRRGTRNRTHNLPLGTDSSLVYHTDIDGPVGRTSSTDDAKGTSLRHTRREETGRRPQDGKRHSFEVTTTLPSPIVKVVEFSVGSPRRRQKNKDTILK
ncbi:protein trachealess [Caerostris extrusa]|uniref:Protein trachealess n=1 Tax=Caerostris extrusa TaxID=172846 RepID=A0AAV4MC88_CAEEX|nr:protein trachealess [Caerostris extrusa]